MTERVNFMDYLSSLDILFANENSDVL